jgi:hypothetical protein
MIAEVAPPRADEFPRSPIIFASGYSETAVTGDVLNEKALLLHKPFHLADYLRSAIRSLLTSS